MTIGEHISDRTYQVARDRLEKLKEIGAPSIVIDQQQNYVDNFELKISGDIEVLDKELISIVQKKGRGGKNYYIINGDINFFPNAKYGMYIKKGDSK